MPPKLHFILAPGVRAELRKIERDTAMRILVALTRYARTGEGDVKALEGKLTGSYRLRVGDWRVRFRRLQGGAIYVIAVRNRSDAY
jgi:mRNA interferase RelE/StbE